MHLNLFEKNRFFYSKMRNTYYDQSKALFETIASLSKRKPFPAKEMVRRLEEYLEHLKITFNYASDAIRGLKRKHLEMFRSNAKFGVLEEEVVLCHFLEEMISSTEFLKKRLETDQKVRVYRQRIKRFQGQTPGNDGFLGQILGNLDTITKTELIEIEKLMNIVEERYRVGNNIFSTILKMSDSR